MKEKLFYFYISQYRFGETQYFLVFFNKQEEQTKIETVKNSQNRQKAFPEKQMSGRKKKTVKLGQGLIWTDQKWRVSVACS